MKWRRNLHLWQDLKNNDMKKLINKLLKRFGYSLIKIPVENFIVVNESDVLKIQVEKQLTDFEQYVIHKIDRGFNPKDLMERQIFDMVRHHIKWEICQEKFDMNIIWKGSIFLVKM